MASNSLGTAWIQIKPSMKGMTSSIRSELAGIGGAEGEQTGQRFSSGFAAKMGVISGIAQQAFMKVSSVIYLLLITFVQEMVVLMKWVSKLR